MTRRPVLGDPGSVSRSGAVAQAAARSLTTHADELAGAAQGLARGWTGRAGSAARHRMTELTEATRVLAHELQATGSALQAHAMMLSEAITQGRTLAQRIEAAGLVLDDGLVTLPLGPRGGADAAAEARLLERRQVLQAELDLLRLRTGTIRGQLRSLLRTSGERMGGAARAARG